MSTTLREKSGLRARTTARLGRFAPPGPSVDPSTLSPKRVAAATAALVLGGVAIGTTEFVTMGLLPDIASGIGVSIPTAGHLISAYAVGVVIGAPLFAVAGARFARHKTLLALVALFVVGNLASALFSSYELLMAARLLAGLPHGAFFGLAALVAMDMAKPGRAGRAIGRVMLGIPIANIAGVPLATWLGQNFGWRTAFALVGVLGVLTAIMVAVFVPHSHADSTRTVRRELGDFANTQVWLTLLIGAVGFGGMFAMYSYIAPTVTEVTGLGAGSVPIFLLAYGIGGLIGTTLGGRLTDWSVMKTIIVGNVATGLLLALFTVTSAHPVLAIITLFAISVSISLFVVGLQLRLMRAAGDARTLGAASNHASLNLANALGAWLGGLVIAHGFGYTAPSWVGAGLCALGLVVIIISVRLDRRNFAA